MMETLGNIVFQGLSFVVLGAFCWMVYTYRGQAGRCLRSTMVFWRTSNQRPGAAAVYDNFLAVALTIGALSTGLAAVKATVMMPEAEGLAGMPAWVAPMATVVVALVAVVVVLVEVWTVKAAGKLTFSSKFADEIVGIKKNWMAAASILTVPLVAMWTGVTPERDAIITYLLACVMVTIAVLFTIHTLRGFIRQKVSLLVWFLYLCTVEIFPVCAVMLAVARNYNTYT